MGSINRHQPEETREDLRGAGAVKKIREIVTAARNGFFCTTPLRGGSGGTRPMNVRLVDDHGHLWFLSASDSQQNRELAADPTVHLYFQGAPHSDFLHLVGTATVSTDRGKIGELWEPTLSNWFTGGLTDPRITVIHFTPAEGYYWDTKHASWVAGIKMMVGAALGKTFDDSVEGRLKV